MKKLLLILTLSCMAFYSSAQSWRVWATYYGGSSADLGYNIATDASGNVYICGQTYSDTGIASATAHQLTYGGGGGDAFLVKFNSNGVRQWGTYYGGSGSDYGTSVKIDAAGNVYLTGYTSSTDSIATAGTYQPTLNGAPDAYLVKFNSAGVRQWATYYGKSAYDEADAVSTDGSGNVYIAGYTDGTSGFATAGAHQLTSGGSSDGFLAKFDGSNGTRIWSTFYGGAGNDYAHDVATDASGNVIICGYTSSSDSIASAGAFLTTYQGLQDAFVAKFNSSGTRLWATYYGDNSIDFGNGIAVGPGKVIYLTGLTACASGIASGGFQNTYGGNRDSYLVKFDSSGTRIWATYYGGAATEEGDDVAVDGVGNVFISGDTYSTNGGDTVATANGFQTSLMGTENHFLAAFTSSGSRLGATYYGKNHEEEGHVAVSNFGDAYMEGFTPSSFGISYNGHQMNFGGSAQDAFLVKYTTSVMDTGIIVPNDTFPPVVTVVITNPVKITYASIELFNGGGISLSNAFVKDFSPGVPLPTSGSSTISCTGKFAGTYMNGTVSTAVSGDIVFKVKVTVPAGQSLPTSQRFFDTEILQLDLSGGNLPTGVKFRESPTLQSLGHISLTDIGSGQFRMASFFDVFTEVSIDGGNTWQPNEAPPERITLTEISTNSVPTLGEWGLISLSLLMLSIGIFYIKKA